MHKKANNDTTARSIVRAEGDYLSADERRAAGKALRDGVPRASVARFRRRSATVAEVLKDYGYNTGAWGKWHNTPEEQITSKGPFDYWPTGYGFEYFYGFLAGEASQYEPTLVRNTT